MKKKIVKGLIKGGLLIAMIAMMVGQPAKAQSLAYGLRASIPFDFKVGDKTFSAGRYAVSRVQQDDVVIKVSSVEGKGNTFRGTVPVTITMPESQVTYEVFDIPSVPLGHLGPDQLRSRVHSHPPRLDRRAGRGRQACGDLGLGVLPDHPAP